MADMRGYGSMDLEDRGGTHDFHYEDGRATPPTPFPPGRSP
ncbi:MAG: hypothetical protein AAFV96_09715 [Pseudomonadota bacterium]